MMRTLTLSLLTLFILTATTTARAGTIYVETQTATVAPGSTGNLLNIFAKLDSADYDEMKGIVDAASGIPGTFSGFNGFDLTLKLDPGGDISMDIGSGVFESDLIPVTGIPQPFIAEQFVAEGTRSLLGASTVNPGPGTFKLASVIFSVAPSASNATISPSLLAGTIHISESGSTLDLLTLDGSSPGAITIMGASSSGPGGTVPEPASLLVWSILGLAGVARARRRKGKLAVA